MWSSENQRLGFKECSPLAYRLTGLAFIAANAAVLSLLPMAIFFLRELFASHLSADLASLFYLPTGLALTGWLSHKAAWLIVRKKNFAYDYAADRCRWDA